MADMQVGQRASSTSGGTVGAKHLHIFCHHFFFTGGRPPSSSANTTRGFTQHCQQLHNHAQSLRQWTRAPVRHHARSQVLPADPKNADESKGSTCIAVYIPVSCMQLSLCPRSSPGGWYVEFPSRSTWAIRPAGNAMIVPRHVATPHRSLCPGQCARAALDGPQTETSERAVARR